MSLFRVAAGKEKNRYDSYEKFDKQKFEVEHIHYKFGYEDSLGNYFADIAIVVLKTPIVFLSYISPIYLPFGKRWLDDRTRYPTEKGDQLIFFSSSSKIQLLHFFLSRMGLKVEFPDGD